MAGGRDNRFCIIEMPPHRYWGNMIWDGVRPPCSRPRKCLLESNRLLRMSSLDANERRAFELCLRSRSLERWRFDKWLPVLLQQGRRGCAREGHHLSKQLDGSRHAVYMTRRADGQEGNNKPGIASRWAGINIGFYSIPHLPHDDPYHPRVRRDCSFGNPLIECSRSRDGIRSAKLYKIKYLPVRHGGSARKTSAKASGLFC